MFSFSHSFLHFPLCSYVSDRCFAGRHNREPFSSKKFDFTSQFEHHHKQDLSASLESFFSTIELEEQVELRHLPSAEAFGQKNRCTTRTVPVVVITKEGKEKKAIDFCFDEEDLIEKQPQLTSYKRLSELFMLHHRAGMVVSLEAGPGVAKTKTLVTFACNHQTLFFEASRRCRDLTSANEFLERNEDIMPYKESSIVKTVVHCLLASRLCYLQHLAKQGKVKSSSHWALLQRHSEETSKNLQSTFQFFLCLDDWFSNAAVHHRAQLLEEITSKKVGVVIDEAQAFFPTGLFWGLNSDQQQPPSPNLKHHYRTTILNALLYHTVAQLRGFMAIAGTTFSQQLCAQVRFILSMCQLISLFFLVYKFFVGKTRSVI